MPRRVLKGLCLFVLAIPVAFVLCVMMGLLPPSSTGGTLPSGRSVVAYSNSIYLTTLLDGDTATIKTAFKTILVKPTGLFVDGSNVASLDPKVANIEVHVKNGTIRVLADGRVVVPTTR